MACHRVTAVVFVIWLLIPCGLPQGSSLNEIMPKYKHEIKGKMLEIGSGHVGRFYNFFRKKVADLFGDFVYSIEEDALSEGGEIKYEK